ncbi:hypothetical protein [Dysgonomonas sp. ZJ709]|uniref:hypothetical protein n=1 Tax=Dysgonomonas sp. ZJ709 TaxID=2709797 RepID=UPI002102ACAE|nr:hypothetical protein [Dysgonomonas sp. ZJ709]
MRKTFLLIVLIFSCINILAQGNQFVGTNDESLPLGWGTRLYFAGNALNSDDIWIAKYNVATNQTDLRVNIADDIANSDRFVVGGRYYGDGKWYERFIVTASGTVGIGVAYPNCALDVKGEIKADKLTVAGDINARQVKIEINAGADFVFQPDYNLKPLSEVEQFVKTNKHLPEIPSEKQMIEEGVNVIDMQIKLLQKIEELTLYTIDLNKQVQELKKELYLKK